MAIVNICRPAWKGPRVTRRTISLSLSLSLSLPLSIHDDRSTLFTFCEVSLNEFQTQHASAFSLSSFTLRSTIVRASQENKLFPHEYRSSSQFLSFERRRIPNNGRESVNARWTGQQHWKMARVTRWTFTMFGLLAFFPSFARETTTSRSQDATVSGVRQLSFALSLDEIDNINEDVSMSCILGFLVCDRNEKVFHENAYMHAIENSIVLTLKDTLGAVH